MGPETRNLLEENLRLTKENNRLLRKLKRAQTLGTVFRIIWIAVIVGLPVALYVYLIQPYYEGVQTRFESLQQKIDSIPGVEKILEKIKHQSPVK